MKFDEPSDLRNPQQSDKDVEARELKDSRA